MQVTGGSSPIHRSGKVPSSEVKHHSKADVSKKTGNSMLGVREGLEFGIYTWLAGEICRKNF